MMSTEARILMDLATGQIEVEGTEAFVSAQFAQAIQMMKELGTWKVSVVDKTGNCRDEPHAESSEKSEPKKRKRSTSRRSGPSCGSRILTLKDEGFFDEQRSTSDVKAKLQEKATPYQSNQIAAAMKTITENGHLRRVKDDGVWQYIKP